MSDCNPLTHLLRPRSLAFVGVSTKGGSGVKMMQSARRFGFSGSIWPVHPTAEIIDGRPCYSSLASLPETPDCVVVAVPAPSVLQVLQEAHQKNIRAALVVSEGFADAANDEGRTRQTALISFAKDAGMAIAGPNCMGVASFGYQSAATMADIPETATVGGISLVSQSGGLLNAVAELCSNRGIGLNFMISIGNQAIVDLADYIDFLVDDPKTRVIAVIMEGAKDGQRFRASIERAAAKKPVVILKLGRSEIGQAATLAHTGTLAGRHEAFSALFEQNGAALVDSLDELVETAALFDISPLPNGQGICMFTVSGGATSLIGDLGEKAGLKFPSLSQKTNDSLEHILDVSRSFGNPLDTVGMPRLIKDGNIEPLVRALIKDDDINLIGLVLGMRSNGAASHEDLVNRMADMAKTSPKPLLVISFISNSLTAKWRGYAQSRGLPILEDLEIGLKAVRHLIRFASKRSARSGLTKTGSTEKVDFHGVLTEAQSKIVLGRYGLPVTKEFLASTAEQAAEFAKLIDAPVAIKIQSPDIPHKSDIGGVRLGLRGSAEVKAAASEVIENARRNCPNARLDGVLVQEMVEKGVEFILGMTLDEQLGPLIVLGAGGTQVEIFKDAASRLAPLTREDVIDMISSLKSRVLLEGFRGTAPADTEALIKCCLDFSAFIMATRGQILAVDINPLIVKQKGKGAQIADALIISKSHQE